VISARLASAKETKAHEYLLRFVFGGAATACDASSEFASAGCGKRQAYRAGTLRSPLLVQHVEFFTEFSQTC